MEYNASEGKEIIMEIKKFTEYTLTIEENKTEILFHLNSPKLERFFKAEDVLGLNEWQNEGIEIFIEKLLNSASHESEVVVIGVDREGDDLKITLSGFDEKILKLICEGVRAFYEKKEFHVSRMFGSFVVLQKKGEILQAVKATPIPIKYCPLMIKLLKEIGGESAEVLIKTLQTEDEEKQTQNMCKLINEVVIKGGYFDTNRPLNSCEANVLFGASETISSAMEAGRLDCSVIVSNNLGTIITTNASNTQGAVKRMTGLFYSSPSAKFVKTAKEAGIIPVFPYTAKIDQLAGVKEAIRLGFKNIAVSVAWQDNILHKELKSLEKNGVKIFKFGLCSTGISEEAALSMRQGADIVWSCASKYVKEYIAPNAIAQVGIKIPVYIMTQRGLDLAFNHLLKLDNSLTKIDLKKFACPVFYNRKGKIEVIDKSNLHSCTDCPHPCV